ncbi:MAG TPA: SDR family NAD(P)-dependent oxidoreductase [Burkholderiales bacterium]|nr:SDR family NAD(P)-dependent oxidoreductase [Burkholderiales bacterium]
MKTALVTGAAKPDSIGHEVALRLLKEGMQVVVGDLYEEGFAALKQCFCVRCDVADPSSVEEMIRRTVERFGRIDVLVNCVGGSWGITRKDLVSSPPLGFRGLTNCSLEDWRTIVAANLDSVFYAARAAAPHLKKQGGAIVNVASVAARKGIPPGSEGSSGPYAVAKAGVMGLTRQLALELGPFGVRVNCVAPGVIASGRLKRVLELNKKDHGPEGSLKTIPMGRVGTVSECAALIVALCTDDTSYMTGVTVDANGASYAA